jgi:hypothetical protein
VVQPGTIPACPEPCKTCRDLGCRGLPAEVWVQEERGVKMAPRSKRCRGLPAGVWVQGSPCRDLGCRDLPAEIWGAGISLPRFGVQGSPCRGLGCPQSSSPSSQSAVGGAYKMLLRIFEKPRQHAHYTWQSYIIMVHLQDLTVINMTLDSSFERLASSEKAWR